MNKCSFEIALGNAHPKKIAAKQSCVTAAGNAMNSYGVHEVDLWVKGKKLMHPVIVIEELKTTLLA
jgi:hypothetical protein